MANPQRGEVSLVVQDKTYTLVLDLDAICQLEALLSTPQHPVSFPDVLALVLRLNYTNIRAFIWASLRRHHSTVTVQAAGELIEAAGGVDAVFAQLNALAGTTRPDADDMVLTGTADRP